MKKDPKLAYTPFFNSDKGLLIDYAFQRVQPPIRRFADLGGVWNVDGAYTQYTLDTYRCDSAAMVDLSFTGKVKEFAPRYPALRLMPGSFGDKHVRDSIGVVDAIFLFDVLLHQVRPDWNEILEMYAGTTRCFLIFNQQWIGAKSVRLIDMGVEQYFSNVPHTRTESPYAEFLARIDEVHPRYADRKWRDVPDVWQWGVTDLDLTVLLDRLGFQLVFYMNCGRVAALRNFENHMFCFAKRSS